MVNSGWRGHCARCSPASQQRRTLDARRWKSSVRCDSCRGNGVGGQKIGGGDLLRRRVGRKIARRLMHGVRRRLGWPGQRLACAHEKQAERKPDAPSNQTEFLARHADGSESGPFKLQAGRRASREKAEKPRPDREHGTTKTRPAAQRERERERERAPAMPYSSASSS